MGVKEVDAVLRVDVRWELSRLKWAVKSWARHAGEARLNISIAVLLIAVQLLVILVFDAFSSRPHATVGFLVGLLMVSAGFGLMVGGLAWGIAHLTRFGRRLPDFSQFFGVSLALGVLLALLTGFSTY